MTARNTHAQDPALALPTATHGIPALAPALDSLGERHALLLTEEVSAADVEALAVSLDEHAGWVGPARLQLAPQVELHGPFALPTEHRARFDLPEWVAQVMILEAPVQRSGPLPAELAGTSALGAAFPHAQPEAEELLALTRLVAIARRLAGGLLVCGDGPRPEDPPAPHLLVPDPRASVNLRVYAPIWLAPEACEALLAPAAVGLHVLMDPIAPPAAALAASHAMAQDHLEALERELGAEVLEQAWREAREREAARRQDSQTVPTRSGYGLTAPINPEREAWGHVDVRVEGAEEVPLAVSGQPWAAGGSVLYQLLWVPENVEHQAAHGLGRRAQAEREAATILIEDLADLLARHTEGVIVDAEGFLVEF